MFILYKRIILLPIYFLNCSYVSYEVEYVNKLMIFLNRFGTSLITISTLFVLILYQKHFYLFIWDILSYFVLKSNPTTYKWQIIVNHVHEHDWLMEYPTQCFACVVHCTSF